MKLIVCRFLTLFGIEVYICIVFILIELEANVHDVVRVIGEKIRDFIRCCRCGECTEEEGFGLIIVCRRTAYIELIPTLVYLYLLLCCLFTVKLDVTVIFLNRVFDNKPH